MELMSLLAKLTLDKSQYDDGLKEAEKQAGNLNIATPQIPRPATNDFSSGLHEAADEGNWFKEVMTGVWEGVKDAFIATGLTTLVLGFVGALKQGISLAINNGKAISDGAKNLGISTKAYQEYEYVLGKSNLKMKDLSTAMGNLDKLMGGSKLTEQQAGWLEKLGINAGEAASKEELLSKVMGSLANYTGSDKGLIVNWLFGNNQNWDGFFSQTTSDISKLKQEADNLGVIMSDDSVENAVKFSEATEQLNDKIESIKRSFGEGILPLLTDAVEKVSAIIAFFGGGEKSLSELMAGSDEEYAKQIVEIEGTGKAAETLLDKLLEMGDTSRMTAEQYEIWKGTAQELIGLVPSLSEVINTETGEITGNTESLKENIKQWENLAKQKALQNLKEEKYQQIVGKNKDLIDKTVEANKKAADADKARITSLDKVNEQLQRYGHEGLGENATFEDYQKAREEILAGLQGDEYGMAQAMADLSTAANEWTTAIGKANAAEVEVANLQKQLAEGEQEYEDWLAAIDTLYGTTAESAENATGDVNGLKETLDNLPSEKHIYIYTHSVNGDEPHHTYAIGSAYIPYDQMALLHRGERVLTATENRRGESGGGNIDFTALEDKIVSSIRAGMEGATVRSFLNGKDITDEVNRNNINAVKGRRFAT